MPNFRTRATSSIPGVSWIYKTRRHVKISKTSPKKDRKGSTLTVQGLFFLKVVKNSGSSAGVASFSYFSSSASLCESAASAVPVTTASQCLPPPLPIKIEHVHAPSPSLRADTENALEAETGATRAASAERVTARGVARAASEREDEAVSWRRARRADMVDVVSKAGEQALERFRALWPLIGVSGVFVCQQLWIQTTASQICHGRLHAAAPHLNANSLWVAVYVECVGTMEWLRNGRGRCGSEPSECASRYL